MTELRSIYYPNFNPIMFTIGSVSFYWYGMMYVLGFMYAIYSLKSHSNYYSKNTIQNKKDIDYLLCLSFVGILLGGRIGYVLFYLWSFFLQDMSCIFKIWEGGMSFHGGLIGVIIAIAWFVYRKNYSFFQIADFVTPVIPVGLGLGRLGNFINGELWGRVSFNVPWVMCFSNSRNQDMLSLQYHPEWRFLFDYYGTLPRHPSQLYEMFLEGVVLFIIINIFIHRSRPTGSVSSLFLICYGIFRIIAEFFREPDINVGFINNVLTMGQILSLPMVIFGIIIMYFAYNNKFK